MALFGRESERDQQRAEAWAQWFRAQNPFALASLVLGIFSLIEFGALIIFGVAGIVLGGVALVQIKRRKADRNEAKPADAPVAPRPATAVNYATNDLPPPIDAKDYERVDEPVQWTEGRRIACIGIITSALSLVLAALLYLRVFG